MGRRHAEGRLPTGPGVTLESACRRFLTHLRYLAHSSMLRRVVYGSPPADQQEKQITGLMRRQKRVD